MFQENGNLEKPLKPAGAAVRREVISVNTDSAYADTASEKMH